VGETSGGDTSLTVAVLTYLRPRDIAEALPLLVEQCRAVRALGVRARVLVVDNDPAGSARTVVEEVQAGLDASVEVRYVNETTPGISAARNRALDEAADEDLLVYIDDDERPSPRWLSLLVEAYRQHGAAAVVGPVVSRFEVEPDSWIVAGRFFDRRRLPTGTRLEVAATNNLLLDLRQVRALDLRFDPEFGTAGGEDTMFTKQLRRRGGEMVWCDEAVVVDVVPASRLTRRWVLLRALSSGNSWSLTSVELASGLVARIGTRLALSARGLVRMAGGVTRLLAGAVRRSQAQHARGLRTLARGTGMLIGAWGISYEEYRRARA
jgi:hypothetical protein